MQSTCKLNSPSAVRCDPIRKLLLGQVPGRSGPHRVDRSDLLEHQFGPVELQKDIDNRQCQRKSLSSRQPCQRRA